MLTGNATVTRGLKRIDWPGIERKSAADGANHEIGFRYGLKMVGRAAN